MTAFTGFTEETTTFLRALGDNNNKYWFDAHRNDYETSYLEPAKQFVVALGRGLSSMDPNITAIPQVNKSIFRINNDTRFSKSVLPYKDHIDLWFYHGDDRKSVCSGFYFRLTSEEVCLGAGIHRFEKNTLEKFRAAVVGDVSGPLLKETVKSLTAKNYQLPEKYYKKVPKGYSEDKNNELLKYNVFHVSRMFDLPDSIYRPEFVKWCEEHYTDLQPLHQWLLAYVVSA